MPPKHEHECTISVANCTGGSGVTCGDYQVCIGSCPGGEVCNSTASGCDCVEFATPQCGNGVIEQDEECEPPNSWVAIQIIPCQFGGYTTSWVGCDHTCHFTGNFNMWPPCPEGAEDPYCGDEKIGGDEQCDPPGEKWKIMDVDCEWPPPDQETWWCECDGQCKLFQYADPECADKPPDPPPNNWVTVLIDWFIALLEGVGEAITNALQKIF